MCAPLRSDRYANLAEAIEEPFAFAEKIGVERRRLGDLLVQTVFDCPAYRHYRRLIAEQRFEPGLFKL
jgi:3-hydroxyisobutyrate dehydrogenase-like beta-hydroxyacid dehydrogenase